MARTPILIVDNDLHTIQTLSATLKLELPDADIHTCDSSLASFERIRAVDYDLIISEINMPHQNGLGFLCAVRKLRAETPVLLMTRNREQTIAIQALAAGAYDLLSKPIHRSGLMVSVRHALEVSRLRRQVRTQAEELLETLRGAVEDLEVLYRAYGLRSHLEAIVEIAHGRLSKTKASTSDVKDRSGRSSEVVGERSTGQLIHFPLSGYSQ
jgi:DNA-binding NtrC family response regulator